MRFTFRTYLQARRSGELRPIRAAVFAKSRLGAARVVVRATRRLPHSLRLKSLLSVKAA